MGEPQRIQLSRQKGARLPENTVKVDRTTRFGNPYRVGEPVDMKQAFRWGWSFSPSAKKFVCQDAEEAVRRFAHCVLWDAAIHDFIRMELRGKNLACWCVLGEPCHADTLLVLANSDPSEITEIQCLIDARIVNTAREVLEQKHG